jgi:protoheme IX farnesyltransferase
MKNYWSVVKPGILFGNLISAAGGFLLASKGRIDPALLLWTLVAIALVVASGCVFNNCLDRNIDRKMARTRNRVLARGLMSPKAAVLFASLLLAGGVTLLRAATNTLALAIVMTGLVVYVGVYTSCLKRKSVYGTLIGSLAGVAPPVAGYCAVTGRFDTGALILLLIFGLWQIPHAYAIAIFRFEDYAAAALPTLPVRRGMAAARRQILGYILAFTTAAVLLTFSGYTGYSYLVVVAALGISWLYTAWSGYRAPDERRWARKVFALSILNIFALSVMMSIDFATPVTSYALLTCAPTSSGTSGRDTDPATYGRSLSCPVGCLHRPERQGFRSPGTTSPYLSGVLRRAPFQE